MSTITTTTNASPVVYPGNTLIDRSPATGYLYAMVKASTADTYQLFRSTDQGASWSLYLSAVRANLQELGSIRMLRYPYDQLAWCYRTSESNQDRIYLRTLTDLTTGTPAWNPEVLVSSVANGGTPGLVYTGIDLDTVVVTAVNLWVVVAVGTEQGGKVGTTLFGLTGGPYFALRDMVVNNNIISGYRQWMTTGSGRSSPSISIEHNGDGKSTSTPHLWVGWGRTHTYLTKLAWNGSGWNGASSFVQLDTATLTAQDYIAARFDGSRFVMAAPDPVSTSTVVVWERNKANSLTTIRNTPTHPTGVITSVGLSWNTVTGDLRVFATGTSTAVLYYADYIRQTGLWSSWTQVTATAILGTPPNKWNIRQGSLGSPTRFDAVTCHSGAPNTVAYTSLGLNYAPNTPTWDTAAMGRNSGESADVNAPLVLDWAFSDPNPADTQSAYAVSRQIGAGALNYWRASDSTWQAAEVKNTSGTSAITLAQAWAAGSDAAYTFKAKVWDAADSPSGYSDGFVVVPSTVVNPALTAPTHASTITTGQVTATWTAAEQTARRVRLLQAGAYDTFGRTVAAGSWGNPDYVGTGTWNVSPGADHSVTTGVGLQSLGSVNVFRTALADILSSDQRIVVDVSLPVASPTGAAITQWVLGRYADANNHYVSRLDLLTTGVVRLSLYKRTTGTLSGALATVDIQGGHAANDIWRIAFDVVGNVLSTKAWIPATQAEPLGWQLTVTDGDIITGTQFGVQARLETGNTNTLPVVTSWRNVFASQFIVHDSGWVNSTALSYTVPVDLPDLTPWIIGVRTRNNEALYSTEQMAGFNVDMIEPAAPTIVTTPTPGSGIISVAITNPAPVGSQPALSTQDLYRRPFLYPVLNSNPFIEVDASDWSGVGATVTRSTTQAHQGVASLRIVPVSGAQCTAETGLYNIDPALFYSGECWMRFDTANKAGVLYLHWFDGSSMFIASTAFTIQQVATAWIYAFVSAIPPAGAAKVKLAAGVQGTPAPGDAVYADELKLRRYNADAGVRVAASLASGASYSDWGPVHGIEYEYRVFARSAIGTSTYGPWTQ